MGEWLTLYILRRLELPIVCGALDSPVLTQTKKLLTLSKSDRKMTYCIPVEKLRWSHLFFDTGDPNQGKGSAVVLLIPDF